MYDVQVPPPLMGMPGAFFQVDGVERRRAQRSADRVALDFGNEKELPDDLAGLRLEREHVALAALEVPARIADEDEAVRRDRGRRHRLAMFRVRDCRFPNSLAGLEVIGQHPPVLGAAKQHAVHVGGASVGRQKGGGIVLVRSPILGASRRVERENIELGRADQSVIHHDQTGLKGGELIDVVRAQDLQLTDILRVDLAELRVTLRRECFVVARPVFGGVGRWRRGGS